MLKNFGIAAGLTCFVNRPRMDVSYAICDVNRYKRPYTLLLTPWCTILKLKTAINLNIKIEISIS